MADIIHSGQVSNTDDRRHEIQIYNNTNTQLQIHITTNTLVQIHITTNTQLQIHITTNTLVQIPNCEYTNTNIIPQVRCPTRDSLLAAGFIRLPFTRSRFMGDILWGQFLGTTIAYCKDSEKLSRFYEGLNWSALNLHEAIAIGCLTHVFQFQQYTHSEKCTQSLMRYLGMRSARLILYFLPKT